MSGVEGIEYIAPDYRAPGGRALSWDQWWGEEGDYLVVFGHVDRDELVAAARAFARVEYDEDVDVVDPPAHVFAVVLDPPPENEDEPWLYFQTEPDHPSGRPVIPCTVAAAGYYPATPAVADAEVLR